LRRKWSWRTHCFVFFAYAFLKRTTHIACTAKSTLKYRKRFPANEEICFVCKLVTEVKCPISERLFVHRKNFHFRTKKKRKGKKWRMYVLITDKRYQHCFAERQGHMTSPNRHGNWSMLLSNVLLKLQAQLFLSRGLLRIYLNKQQIFQLYVQDRVELRGIN